MSAPTADPPEYRRAWWDRGRHLQTIWGSLFRRPSRPPLRRERWLTPDGDFLDLDWLEGGPPLVLILHGLEGSSRSHYARGLLREAARVGWQAVVLHFRSCGGELNRTRRLYDAGETSDLDWVVRRLGEREPSTPLGLVGFSLGGNVALKWLGERGDGVPAQVRAAVTISTPFDLTVCAESLDRGINRRLYTARFLRSMKAKVGAKRQLYDGLVNVPAVLRARTFAVYDRFATAPINGFADERDYRVPAPKAWVRASSGPYLARIRRPCLLINALNDPFIPASTLPVAAVAASSWLEAEFLLDGGHVGFLEDAWGSRSWAERRA